VNWGISIFRAPSENAQVVEVYGDTRGDVYPKEVTADQTEWP
jgi:hypothetical protein